MAIFVVMDRQSLELNNDIKEFLTSRREQITPDKMGLPIYGERRLVKGLRREEVAMLAGVSVDYYTRLERDHIKGASHEVLQSVAKALQLNEAETAHFFDLAHASAATPVNRRRAARAGMKDPVVREELRRIIDAMGDIPAFIRTDRRDLLYANQMGRAIFSPLYESRVSPGLSGQANTVNVARFMFLDPAAHEFFPHWDDSAADLVASLRGVAGKNPFDTVFSNLLGELLARSEDFAQLWAAHDVRLHRAGHKVIVHPVVGELSLDFETLELPADEGLAMITYSAAPNTPTYERLSMLASWMADPHTDETQAELPNSSDISA